MGCAPIDYYLDDLVAYEGPKVSLIATGGGIGATQLGRLPGASKLLAAAYVPYDAEETASFIESYLKQAGSQPFRDKAVSQEAVRSLALAGARRWPDNRVIVCSAALTTIRIRQGDNHAWLADRAPGSTDVRFLHMKFDKLPVETEPSWPARAPRDTHVASKAFHKRMAEDDQITEMIFRLIFNKVELG